MTGNAEETRQRLIEAATRGFAEQGVHSASLLEITRQAGQRNRGAVHYHFGSREGMLVAVLEQHVDMLATREKELLKIARQQPDDDLASAVAAFVRPAVELGDLGWEGRSYLVILSELIEDDPDSLHPDVVAALTRAGGYEAYGLLEERMPPMSDELRLERMSLTTSFILRAVADRARSSERPHPSRHQLDTESFVRNVIAMSVGMLTAPIET
ncbi:MAG TPA: TetR family transcriptional regulator [Nocardioides sp.]|nr:TetR family transcriptional regulator [Nocardioides sp.]